MAYGDVRFAPKATDCCAAAKWRLGPIATFCTAVESVRFWRLHRAIVGHS